MSRFRTAALVGGAALALAACGDDTTPRPPNTTSGGSTTTTTTGAGGAGGAGGQGGQGGAPLTCGDGVVDAGEACDGADLDGQTCVSAGFDSGTLACTGACALDTSGCTGVERCQDGIDNDGDGAVDCDDPDCQAACDDACLSPQVLADPFEGGGVNAGHAPLAEPLSCVDPPGGSAVMYRFTATTTGLLDIDILASTPGDLALAVRTTCDGAATEIACANLAAGEGAVESLSTPIMQGQTVFIAVSGGAAGVSGSFILSARSRSPMCGDGIQDTNEECDDSGTVSGDGCSDQCMVESTEVEPNGSALSANPFVDPFYGSISPAGDVDVISVVVPSGPTSLVAETVSITTAACLNNQVDSFIEILGPDGAAVLASDDDGGSGMCARAVAPALAAGTYFVRVRAFPGAIPPTFAYQLALTMIPDVCGDGNITPGEQCDDGNTSAGDGCSPTCQIELHEVEPNNTPMAANAYSVPWFATIAPALDVDVVSVSVPGPSSTLSASVLDPGNGACAANLLDSFIEILGTNGTTVLAMDDDSGPGYCSAASIAGLSAGTYYVRVKAAPFQMNATFLYQLVATVQ